MTDAELDWFAARAIPVTLLAERRVTHSAKELVLWVLNGKPHRENDLPAIHATVVDTNNPNVNGEWWVHGKLHRDGDRHAKVVAGNRHWYIQRWWYFKGKLHRDGGRPTNVRADGWTENMSVPDARRACRQQQQQQQQE